MSQADNTPTTSRRNALRFGAAAAVTGFMTPAIAAPARDAALLDLCRQFEADSVALRRNDAITKAECDADPSISLDQATLEFLCERWNDTIVRITAIPTSTTGGIRAKGGALRHALMQRVAVEMDGSFEDQAEDYELLAMSLARDLAAVPG